MFLAWQVLAEFSTVGWTFLIRGHDDEPKSHLIFNIVVKIIFCRHFLINKNTFSLGTKLKMTSYSVLPNISSPFCHWFPGNSSYTFNMSPIMPRDFSNISTSVHCLWRFLEILAVIYFTCTLVPISIHLCNTPFRNEF